MRSSTSYDSAAGAVQSEPKAPVRPGRTRVTADIAVVYLLQ